jgi:hypothetical protein
MADLSAVEARLPAGPPIGPSLRTGRIVRFETVALVAMALAVFVWATRLDRPASVSDPGPAAAEAFVRAYVTALNANDPVQLGQLLGEASGSREVADRLTRFGGRGLAEVRVSVINEFPRIYRVAVSARSVEGATVALADVIEWTGSRWHMAPLQPAPTTP